MATFATKLLCSMQNIETTQEVEMYQPPNPPSWIHPHKGQSKFLHTCHAHATHMARTCHISQGMLACLLGVSGHRSQKLAQDLLVISGPALKATYFPLSMWASEQRIQGQLQATSRLTCTGFLPLRQTQTQILHAFVLAARAGNIHSGTRMLE